MRVKLEKLTYPNLSTKDEKQTQEGCQGRVNEIIGLSSGWVKANLPFSFGQIPKKSGQNNWVD